MLSVFLLFVDIQNKGYYTQKGDFYGLFVKSWGKIFQRHRNSFLCLFKLKQGRFDS